MGEILAALAGGIGVYAAIRADLALLHERTKAQGERLARVELKVFP